MSARKGTCVSTIENRLRQLDLVTYNQTSKHDDGCQGVIVFNKLRTDGKSMTHTCVEPKDRQAEVGAKSMRMGGGYQEHWPCLG